MHHVTDFLGRDVNVLHVSGRWSKVSVSHLHAVELGINTDLSPGTVIHVEVDIEDSQVLLEWELTDEHRTFNLVREFYGLSSFIFNQEAKSIRRESFLEGLKSSLFAVLGVLAFLAATC
jgi:hypothetical protein